MRYIDYSNFKPDAEWLKKAKDLTDKMIELHKQGKLEERNKLMEDNSAHWGKLKEEHLKLSHNKCWGSETKDLYSHYDVEHFRPKKEAKDLAGKDIGGYWWLAFDYHNYRICGNVGNRKKGGWFPLKENSPKSKHDDPCEESELIYLIDPIIPEDVNLLAFDEEGKVIPHPVIVDNWEKRRVEVSVERLKLNEHAPLTEARRKIWQEMSKNIEEYYEYKKKCTGTNHAVMKQKLSDVCRKIKKMTKEEEILSSVAKWCILFRNDQQLNNLIF